METRWYPSAMSPPPITGGDDEHGTQPFAGDGVEQVATHTGVVPRQCHKIAGTHYVAGPADE